jgi:hypothetical protein
MMPFRSLLVLFVLFNGFPGFAQEVYESPHVFEGTTFQVDAPKGLYLVKEELGYMEVAYFAADSSLKGKEINPKENPVELFVIMTIQDDASRRLGVLLEEMEPDIKEAEQNDEFHLLEDPKINVYNDREFLSFSMKGEIEGVHLEHYFVAITQFGHHRVMIYYIAPTKKARLKQMKDFVKILETFTVIPTEKEDFVYDNDDNLDDLMNAINELDTSYWDESYEDGSEMPSPNVLETYDFTSDSEDRGWERVSVGFGGQTTSFSHIEDDGTIHVFSGGDFNNYTTEAEMEAAVANLFGRENNPKMTFKNAVKGVENPLMMHEVSDAESEDKIISVYTGEHGGEMLFIVVQEGEESSKDFYSSYPEFVKSIWTTMHDNVEILREEVIFDEGEGE